MISIQVLHIIVQDCTGLKGVFASRVYADFQLVFTKTEEHRKNPSVIKVHDTTLVRGKKLARNCARVFTH